MPLRPPGLAIQGPDFGRNWHFIHLPDRPQAQTPSIPSTCSRASARIGRSGKGRTISTRWYRGTGFDAMPAVDLPSGAGGDRESQRHLRVEASIADARAHPDFRPGREPRARLGRYVRAVTVQRDRASYTDGECRYAVRRERPPTRCSQVARRQPVFFAIRISTRGPISASSLKAKTKSGQPSPDSVRCEPDVRLIVQPIRSNAARTRRVFAAGQPLTRP